jgi:GTPase SAR1 family protein
MSVNIKYIVIGSSVVGKTTLINKIRKIYPEYNSYFFAGKDRQKKYQRKHCFI